MKYICDRCGKRTPAKDAYQISKFYNGVQIKQIVCRDCIRKIGEDITDAESYEVQRLQG